MHCIHIYNGNWRWNYRKRTEGRSYNTDYVFVSGLLQILQMGVNTRYGGGEKYGK